MHILLLALDYPSAWGGSGVGNQAQLLGRELVRAGHAVSVIAFLDPDTRPVEDDAGVRVYRIRRGPLHWYVSKIPGFGGTLAPAIRELEDSWLALRIARRIHRHRPIDVIEGTETGALGVALALRAAPLVIRLHGEVYTFHRHTPGVGLRAPIRLQRAVQRLALRRASALISPSRAHAREIAEELRRPESSIAIVPNAVDVPPPRREKNTQSARSGEPALILYAGRLDRSKGILPLLDAMRIVRTEAPATQLVLAGAPHPSLPELELWERIRDLGLAPHIQVAGHVPWLQLLELYDRATVFVLPSYYETFGVAAVEAMTRGVPVVTTAAGGLREVVTDGVTGLTVPAADAKALAAAIVRLLNDEALRCRLADNARSRVAAAFRARDLVDATLYVYQTVEPPRGYVAGADRHVFFGPHYDDIALSCGGLAASLQESGNDVCAVTIFGRLETGNGRSAFVDHLLSKYSRSAPGFDRAEEDRRAFEVLGVHAIDHWNWTEAPGRQTVDGDMLYASYSELAGPVRPADAPLIDGVVSCVRERYLDGGTRCALYFPLSLGGHVDHRILFWAGLRLVAGGHQVSFYEDLPYAEIFRALSRPDPWESSTVPIDLGRKVRAVAEYHSQLSGLGGSVGGVEERLARYARRVGRTGPAERIWRLSPADAQRYLYKGTASLPFRLRARQVRDIILGVRSGLREPNPSDVLPVGSGACIDLQPGDTRVRAAVEAHGYAWTPGRAGAGPGAAAIDWGGLHGLGELHALARLAHGALETGGVFCGRLLRDGPSSTMPWNPGAVAAALASHGFVDVSCFPRTMLPFAPRSIAFAARKAAR